MTNKPHLAPRPFLKWLGGKRQLLPELLQAVEATGAIRTYYEPFLGGGALFFALARSGKLRGEAVLSDVNPNLLDAYLGVRDDVDGVIRALLRHKKDHCEDHYYEVRASVPKTLVERAARIIYLNRTCFNGLYRENSKGLFNVPFGRYKKPLICDDGNLRAVAAALSRARLSCVGFSESVASAAPGDLVYFDPPYAPVSKTSDFTSYSKDGFGLREQSALAETFGRLVGRGVKVLLSNSYTPMTRTLYGDHFIYQVYATRRVNSKADRRGKVSEVLVTSFPLHESAAGVRDAWLNIRVNGTAGNLDKRRARQWLLENAYGDVAALIDEVTAAWKKQGRSTRRNWWSVLAGNRHGESRTIGGREFPVLLVAQLRQGGPVTRNAICRNPMEEVPQVRVTGRWVEGRARTT